MAYQRKGKQNIPNRGDKVTSSTVGRGYRSVDSEAILQRNFVDLLLLHKFLVIRFNSGSARYDGADGRQRFINFYTICNKSPREKHRNSGISDLLAFRDNVAYFFEMKAKGKKQRDSQIAFYKLLEIHGMVHRYVIDDFDSGIAIIKDIVHAQRKPGEWL